MKDRKLLIRVRCTTRKFYLHRPPPGRNDWHVRFTPPSINGVRRVVFRSTGTKEIAAANVFEHKSSNRSGPIPVGVRNRGNSATTTRLSASSSGQLLRQMALADMSEC